MSLIFYLGKQSLEIYQFDKELVLTDRFFHDTFVNLSDNFAHLWQKNSKIINSQNEIYFILKNSASFTDTRIVYLWLQSWQMFGQFTKQNSQNQSLESQNNPKSKSLKEIKSKNLENDLKNGNEIDKNEQNSEFENDEKWEKNVDKNFNLVKEKQFWVHHLKQDLVLFFLENDKLVKMLKDIKTENNQKLIYTQNARINESKNFG